MRIKRNRKNPAPGVLARLAEVAGQKRVTTNKLRGFWRGPKSRPAWRPLVVR